MRVDVLCFGVLRDLLGSERESIALADGARVADLLALFQSRPSANPAIWRSLAVAVNRQYAGLETILAEGDEVALLPPVSGGCPEGPHAR